MNTLNLYGFDCGKKVVFKALLGKPGSEPSIWAIPAGLVILIAVSPHTDRPHPGGACILLGRWVLKGEEDKFSEVIQMDWLISFSTNAHTKYWID